MIFLCSKPKLEFVFKKKSAYFELDVEALEVCSHIGKHAPHNR